MVRLLFLLGGFSVVLFGHQTRAPDECLEDEALLDQLELLDLLLFELLLPLDEDPEEDELLDLEEDLEESSPEADVEETRENLLTKGRPRAVVAGPEIQVCCLD